MPKDNSKLGLPAPTAVRNRRLKMSPGGLITLPVAARKALRMVKGEGARVTASVRDGAIVLESGGDTGGFRVSPGGQLELRGEAQSVLRGGVKRHYWIELNDEAGRIVLRPEQ